MQLNFQVFYVKSSNKSEKYRQSGFKIAEILNYLCDKLVLSKKKNTFASRFKSQIINFFLCQQYNS